VAYAIDPDRKGQVLWQAPEDKIDSNNASGQKNVSNVLAQVRMAIDHPIFDPEMGRKVLLDRLFPISASEITRGVYTFQLTVTDSTGTSTSDLVTVNFQGN
jgi:hypothetical protein